MARIAIVTPAAALRAALVVLAEAGSVDLGPPAAVPESAIAEALRRLARAGDAPPAPLLSETPPADVAALERDGRGDLLRGEAALAARAAGAVRHRSLAGLVGWAPADALPALRARLAPIGAALVELPAPRASAPPTLLRPIRVARPFKPLVETYGAARYTDVDPTPFAAAAFVLMFGLMFGDAGHGAMLALAALALRASRGHRLAGLRPLWPLPFACGIAAIAGGLLYGEAFGPTGIVPTLWLAPADHPLRLLETAIALGVVLLLIGNLLGALNRRRADGTLAALLSPAGGAGFLALAGGALCALAASGRAGRGVLIAGAVVAVAGLALVLAGLVREMTGGAAGVAEVVVELFDTVVRLVGNAVSFSRLAAFGLMHAVIGAVVLDAASALWHGSAPRLFAVLVFAVGTLAAFGIEGLVAAVQALRLEYYELFSRLFSGEGRPFSPWQLPVDHRMPAP
jgi:V/A-type H+-transporting ATPase subunit I